MRAARLVPIVAALAVVAATAGYAASPFYAAWRVHEAIRTGDTTTLERKVAWASVRQSLKASLRAEMQTAMTSEAETRGLGRPTLWQRIKTSVGTGMAERFVDATFSPRGLVLAYSAVKPKDDDGSFGAMMRLAGRTRWIEPLSPTRLRIAMADVQLPSRLFVADLALENWEWRLVALTVAAPPTPAPPGPTEAASATSSPG